MKVTNDKISVGRGFGRISQAGEGDETYLIGAVFTPQAIVSVYSQGGPNFNHHTRLDFVHRGTMHMRSINRRFTKRGLVTIAKRFVRDVLVKTMLR